MKTDIPVFELIDQCEFDMDNPFELENGLFPNLRNHLHSKMVDMFEERVYKTWIDLGFVGESTVSVFYNIMTDRLLKDRYNGYFDHLTQNELDLIRLDFADVIEDEIRHREIFLQIIKKTGMTSSHNIDAVDHTNLEFQKKITQGVETDLYGENAGQACLLGHVLPMLIGETYLLATFNMFHNMSSNYKKQQIFKSLLQDESRHTNHFRTLLRRANINPNDAQRLKTEIIDNIYEFSNFELLALVQFIKSFVKSQEKIDTIIKEAYNDSTHQHFREIFLRKAYQFYSIIYPETTEEQFNTLMNPGNFVRLNLENRQTARDLLFKKNL